MRADAHAHVWVYVCLCMCLLACLLILIIYLCIHVKWYQFQAQLNGVMWILIINFRKNVLKNILVHNPTIIY